MISSSGLYIIQILIFNKKSLTFFLFCRAGSRSGLWMLFLLPLSIIISAFKHSITTTPTYKLASLICTGMVLVSFTIILQRNKNQKLNLLNIWNIGVLIVTSVLFHMCFQRGYYYLNLLQAMLNN